MSDQAVAFTVVLAIAAILGLRATFRLTRRYRAVSPQLDERERLVLGSFVGVAWVITLTASFYGILSARRLLGLDPIAWSATISLLLASAVLLIPAGLDYIVDRVARVPWR
jgi:hypothetical protein